MGQSATALGSTGDDDWFATYSGGVGMAGAPSAAPSAGKAAAAEATHRAEDMAGLSPLLTPSNNKLCAAIVDAF